MAGTIEGDSAVLSLNCAALVGVRFEGGVPIDWCGYTARHYKDLKRATNAARRKYGDASINVTEIVPVERRYCVPLSVLKDYEIKYEPQQE